MSTSDRPGRCYVWVWLPGSTEPTPAGILEAAGDRLRFAYGNSYLMRSDAISLYDAELPLQAGTIEPAPGLTVAGCINDAGPGAWGQRVIARRLTGSDRIEQLDMLTYLLESGSNRIGALDFQYSPTEYVARTHNATLDELQEAASRLESGQSLTDDLDRALLHGSSIGGARPKVLIDDNGRALIAKLSSKSDAFPVVKAEAVAMNLAQRVGLNVANTDITSSLGHDVLLVERFDRTSVPGERRQIVSALTIAMLDEVAGRHATYWGLADTIRERFVRPDPTLRELFARIAFNICVSNTDDHARNHAAFWNGTHLELTPAYDICPQTRSTGYTEQAMATGRNGWKSANLAGLVDHAKIFHLDRRQATALIEHQLNVIRAEFDQAADQAHLTASERQLMWGRQILKPAATDEWPPSA